MRIYVKKKEKKKNTQDTQLSTREGRRQTAGKKYREREVKDTSISEDDGNEARSAKEHEEIGRRRAGESEEKRTKEKRGKYRESELERTERAPFSDQETKTTTANSRESGEGRTKNGFENTYAAAVVGAGRSCPALIRHLMLEGGVPGPEAPRAPLSSSLPGLGCLVEPRPVFLFLSSPRTRRLGHHRQKDRYCF